MILIDQLITCLREWTDVEFQRRTWLSTNGPEVSSFSEQVAQTFDDTGLQDAIEKNRPSPELDLESFAALAELGKAVDLVDCQLTAEELLADPRVEEVRRLAHAALKLVEQHRSRSGPEA